MSLEVKIFQEEIDKKKGRGWGYGGQWHEVVPIVRWRYVYEKRVKCYFFPIVLSAKKKRRLSLFYWFIRYSVIEVAKALVRIRSRLHLIHSGTITMICDLECNLLPLWFFQDALSGNMIKYSIVIYKHKIHAYAFRLYEKVKNKRQKYTSVFA